LTGGARLPSAEFKRMPIPEHIQYVTRVHRHVYPRERRIENKAMRLCWELNGWDIPTKYEPSVPNIPAGYQSFWKYNKSEPTPQKHAFALSKVWTQRHFYPYMAGSRRLPLDVVRRMMDDQTSCGWPWNMTYMNKKQFYDDPVMAQVVPDYLEIIQGVFPCGVSPVWTCTVKGDEMRTREKIAANKLRTFTASPIEHSVALNVFCLDMNEKFYKSNNKTWSFVGATKFDGVWNSMYNRLNKYRNAAALDGKEYDSSLFAQLLWDQMWIRYEMLEPELQTASSLNAMMNLYDSIISSLVVLDMGDLLRKFLGNPSGSANTIVDNTMILFRFFAYAFIRLSEFLRKQYDDARVKANLRVTDPDLQPYTDVSGWGYREMMEHVLAVLNGDDSTYTVSDFIREWFTPRAIADIWSTELGLNTSADNWEYAPLETLSFLSNGFVCITGLWLPTPETEKVLGSLFLGSKVDDIRWHLYRAYALRIDSWANKECRDKIATFINYCWQYHEPELRGVIRDIHMNDIQQVWKTDDQLMKLYAGEESWIQPPIPWRLVGVELNPGPTRTCLILQFLFKDLSYYCLIHCYNTSGEVPMAKSKKGKSSKKVVVKVVKKKKNNKKKKNGGKNTLHGHGGYWGDLGKRLGGHLGGVADEVIGVGKALTGSGSYHIRKNTLLESGGPPTVRNDKGKSFIMRHEEYITDITGSVGFNNQLFPIQPGVANTFPWLQAIAMGFEQYRITGMIFEYRGNSGTAIAGTSAALGSVIMATEYNVNLPKFTSKMQMENHQYTTPVNPSKVGIHPIECARGQTVLTELYTRSAFTGGTPSLNNMLFDWGNFQIATYGMPSAYVVGELWVSYEIEFFKPQLSTTIPQSRFDHYYYDSTLGAPPSNSALLQNMRNKYSGLTTPVACNGFTKNPAGNYIIMMVVNNASFILTTAPTLVATYDDGSGTVPALAYWGTTPSTGVGTIDHGYQPNGTTGQIVFFWGVAATAIWNLSFSGTNISNMANNTSVDFMTIPIGMGLTLAESRRAVDWDPVAILTRKIDDLTHRLESVKETDEKHFSSECSTPMHVEPELGIGMTTSTRDLASSLLTRLAGAAQPKTLSVKTSQ